MMEFQSTHPRRMRLTHFVASLSVVSFQSTHPRRMRQILPFRKERYMYFNPRIRVGCDDIIRYGSLWKIDFNPRIRVGCDPNVSRKNGNNARFQSTHPRRMRRTAAKLSLQTNRNFNPRIRVGCDADSRQRAAG